MNIGFNFASLKYWIVW